MAPFARFSLTCLAALLLAGTAQAGTQTLPVKQTVDVLPAE